jgi:hypothetical protein
MMYQACKFKRKKDGPVEAGIAYVECFDGDAEYIIDGAGKKLKSAPYDYRLQTGPLAYLDTEYRPL